MSDDAFPKLPPPPDPLVVQQIMGQVRAVLPLIGGVAGTLGFTLPVFTDSQLSGYIAAGLVLFGMASYAVTAFWSWMDKIKRERQKREAEVAAAVASANATMMAGRPVPVTVTVTPPGEDNTASRIAPAEIAAAPTVPTDVAPSPAPRP